MEEEEEAENEDDDDNDEQKKDEEEEEKEQQQWKGSKYREFEEELDAEESRKVAESFIEVWRTRVRIRKSENEEEKSAETKKSDQGINKRHKRGNE